MAEKPYHRRQAKAKSRKGCFPTDPKKRRWIFWGIPISLVLIAGIAIAAVVVISKQKQSASGDAGTTSANGTVTGTAKHSTKTGTGKTSSTTATGKATKPTPTTITNNFGVAGNGGDGSTVTTDLQATFTYTNGFGGTWAQDPQNPHNVSFRLDLVSNPCRRRDTGCW